MKNRHNLLKIIALLFTSLCIGAMAFLEASGNMGTSSSWAGMLLLLSTLGVLIGLWFKQRWVLVLINSVVGIVFFVLLIFIYEQVKLYDIDDGIGYIIPFLPSLVFLISIFLFVNNKGVIAEFDRGSDDKYDFEK